MCKKRDARDARDARFFADLNQEFLSIPIALLPFSWPSPLSLLQLPLKLRRRRQCQPMSGY